MRVATGYDPGRRLRAKNESEKRAFLRYVRQSVVACLLPLVDDVDCWIGVVQEPDRRLVRLAGRLSVAQVPELLETCAESLPIELDLTDLVSADAAGIDALQRLRSKGARLVGAPGYLQMKLDSRAAG